MVIQDVKFDEEKEMRCSLDRQIQMQPDQEIFPPKEELQEVMEKS